jgi:hypothetical protein
VTPRTCRQRALSPSLCFCASVSVLPLLTLLFVAPVAVHLSALGCTFGMTDAERGLDGWHVCGEHNQLFYSKIPVVKISDTKWVNIQNFDRHNWTSAMHSAHEEVRSSQPQKGSCPG